MANKKMKDEDVVKFILNCREEARSAKVDRMDLNKQNYNAFHLRHDFGHKQEGQSTEVLSRQAMAVEQIKSFFQQALADLGDWWTAEAAFPGADATMKVRPAEITKLTNFKLERMGYFSHVGNSIESALLASLAITKGRGTCSPKPKFIARKKGRGSKLKRWVEKTEDETWDLKFDVVRAENFYPDPTGSGLYEIEDMWLDYHEVLEMATGEDAIFDEALVRSLPRSGVADAVEETGRRRETNQNTPISAHRPKVKLTEFWGCIIDPTTGEEIYENCVATIANDKILIRPPEPNPLWHQRSPYVYSPLMEVANSVWHKAPMDSPTKHQMALTEVYNLIVDAAMMEVHAIKQLRTDALDNSAQVQDGIRPGMTLNVGMTLPPGAKVLEPVTAVSIPAEALNVFNIMAQEFNSSALTNDLRQGVMPFRAVKATEVVEASQTITSVFQGMAKNYEARQIVRELELAWQLVAQNWDRIDREEFISLFGAQRGAELADLPAEEVFASTVNGIRFRVYGVTLTLSKAQDFRKLTTLLQTITASPQLMEEFVKKYDLGKTLGEIMTSLNIDKYKLEIPQEVQATMMPQEQAPEQGGPDTMSQVPSAASGSLQDLMGGGAELPHTQFPGSPAIPGGNQ